MWPAKPVKPKMSSRVMFQPSMNSHKPISYLWTLERDCPRLCKITTVQLDLNCKFQHYLRKLDFKANPQRCSVLLTIVTEKRWGVGKCPQARVVLDAGLPGDHPGCDALYKEYTSRQEWRTALELLSPSTLPKGAHSLTMKGDDFRKFLKNGGKFLNRL